MNSSPELNIVTTQLLYALPVLFACGVGGVLGLVTLGRSLKAGLLMLGGALLLAITRLMHVGSVALIADPGANIADRARWMSILSGLSTCLGAVAMLMVFVAGFVDRGRPESPWVEQGD